MKKIILGLSVMLLLLTACGSSDAKRYQVNLDRYISLWNTILDEDRYETTSQYFDIEGTMSGTPGDYSYSVVINNARVAMMDIEVLVLEDDVEYHDDKMMVTSGIFDPSSNMVPNQSRPNSNFVGGLLLSAKTEVSQLDLRILVTWKSIDHNEVMREIILLPVKIDI